MKINFGCGSKHKEGWLNVDLYESVKPDQVFDIESFPWCFEDNVAEKMLFSHVLEHVGQSSDVFLKIMSEIYRVAKHDCEIDVFVPHPRHDFYLIDPTHCRPILPETLEMFDRDKNIEWIERKSTKTPLGYFLGVNYHIIKNEYIFERHIIEMMQKNVPREEILNAISTQYNAIQEIKIKLKVDKSWESKPF